MTSSRSSLQSVAKTVEKLEKRFNWHRTGFNKPVQYGFCCILSDHFHKGVCCNACYSVQILDKLEGNGKTARNTFDASISYIIEMEAT